MNKSKAEMEKEMEERHAECKSKIIDLIDTHLKSCIPLAPNITVLTAEAIRVVAEVFVIITVGTEINRRVEEGVPTDYEDLKPFFDVILEKLSRSLKSQTLRVVEEVVAPKVNKTQPPTTSSIH